MPKIVRYSTLPGIKSKKQRKKEIDRLTWSEIATNLMTHTEKLWPEMAPWLRRFSENGTVTGKGMTTQAAIRKVLVLDSQKSYWLALEILRNCFLASKYKEKDREPHSTRRRRIRDYMACRAQVRKNIKRIRSVLKTYSSESVQDIGYANVIMREKYPSVPAIPFTFGNVLECLELALLEPKVFGLNAGAILHRVAVGPLIYPMPVDQQKAQPHAALNGLIFSLAFHFRRATTGRQAEGWMNGEPMPQEGKSHIPLIAHFARATFNNETITPMTVKKRLDSLLKVRNKETSDTITLSGWPQENSPSHT